MAWLDEGILPTYPCTLTLTFGSLAKPQSVSRALCGGIRSTKYMPKYLRYRPAPMLVRWSAGAVHGPPIRPLCGSALYSVGTNCWAWLPSPSLVSCHSGRPCFPRKCLAPLTSPCASSPSPSSTDQLYLFFSTSDSSPERYRNLDQPRPSSRSSGSQTCLRTKPW